MTILESFRTLVTVTYQLLVTEIPTENGGLRRMIKFSFIADITTV
ncbi:MAG: hypothetical protein AB4062_00940 [Crocosphaera sp.]